MCNYSTMSGYGEQIDEMQWEPSKCGWGRGLVLSGEHGRGIGQADIEEMMLVREGL